jgi:hypothetical protein
MYGACIFLELENKGIIIEYLENNNNKKTFNFWKSNVPWKKNLPELFMDFHFVYSALEGFVPFRETIIDFNIKLKSDLISIHKSCTVFTECCLLWTAIISEPGNGMMETVTFQISFLLTFPLMSQLMCEESKCADASTPFINVIGVLSIKD